MTPAAPSGQPPHAKLSSITIEPPRRSAWPGALTAITSLARSAEPSIPGAWGSTIHAGPIHDRSRSVVMESHLDSDTGEKPSRGKLPLKLYEKELARLQEELVKMEEWVQRTGARIVVVFEGRDAAGKGSAIKRITEFLNPRVTKHVALPRPTDRERTQWYFQRYIAELPASGEIVLFDRSWYNRAGIEIVLGLCTREEHRRFLRQCPIFERLLIEDGIRLIKYWFSVSDEEQERRFEARI